MLLSTVATAGAHLACISHPMAALSRMSTTQTNEPSLLREALDSVEAKVR